MKLFASYILTVALSLIHLTSTSAKHSEMTETCTLPDSLTVPYILANTEKSNTTIKEDDERVTEFLTENGVVLSEADEKTDREAAYLALRESLDFWVTRHALHPNRSRVKNWLWVHSRYRDQANEIVKSAGALPYDSPTALAPSAKKLLANFNKFTGKIKAHSEFEDSQLFKFFVEENIGTSSDVFKTLMEEHSSIKQVTEIQEILQKIIEDPSAAGDLNGELTGKVSEYVNDLEAHLKKEEDTIVALWLQLTPAQYKKYRSYLSWKYAMMY